MSNPDDGRIYSPESTDGRSVWWGRLEIAAVLLGIAAIIFIMAWFAPLFVALV